MRLVAPNRAQGGDARKAACTVDAHQQGHRVTCSAATLARNSFTGSTAMLDVLLLALGLGLFVISVGYAFACDRL
jgi:hypothetical protein